MYVKPGVAVVRALARRAAMALALGCASAGAANYGLQARPNLDLRCSGQVNALVRQPDGKLVVGGDFREVDGAPRHNLARLNADGTLDASWHPDTDLSVHALTLDGAGRIYVGGNFTRIGGQSIAALARIDASGVVDVGFNPAPDRPVDALTYDGAGHVYAGGIFSHIEGQAHGGVARIDAATGHVDAGWTVSALGVSAIQATADQVYLAGSFNLVDGEPRPQLARVSASGVLDLDWAPGPEVGSVSSLALGGGYLYVGGATILPPNGTYQALLERIPLASTAATPDPTWTPAPDGAWISAVAVAPDGAVYANGNYTHIGGQDRPQGLARLSAVNGAADPAWTSAVGANLVSRLLALPDGQLLVNGTDYAGAAQHAGLTRLAAADGHAEADFAAQVMADGVVLVIRPFADGSTLVGGNFLTVAGQPRPYLLRLKTDGTLDADWTADVDGAVRAIALDSGAYPIYLGGDFAHVGGAPHGSLARISAAGGVDAGWTPSVRNPTRPGVVYTMVFDGTGQVVVGGIFSSVNGTARDNLAKLALGDGALDLAWAPNPDGPVYSAVGDGQGSVYIGGQFYAVAGTARGGNAKLTLASGALDATWNSPIHGSVRRLLYDSVDQMLYLAGSFSIDGAPPGRLVRVSAAGVRDTAWAPQPATFVRDLALDATGNLYFGSNFTSLNGQPVPNLARTNVRTVASGAIDATWHAAVATPSENATAFVCLALLPGGGVYVGGDFDTAQGQKRLGLAAIGDDLVDGVFRATFE